MRSGKFLAEESPQTLMTMHCCSSLENVFLALSRKQGTSNELWELNISSSSVAGLGLRYKLDASVYISQESGVVGLNFHQSKEVPTNGSINESSFCLNSSISALVPDLMKSQFDGDTRKATYSGKMRALLKKNYLRISRNVTILLFCFALPVLQVVLFCVGIGNDPNGLKLAIANMEVNGTECNFKPGCHFSRLSCRYLSHLNQSFLQEYYSDPESAIEAVKTGQAWGAIYFNANYPVSTVFFLAVSLTSSTMITERTEGLWDRSRVAGVSPREILFSHVITHFVVLYGQTALVLIFVLTVFSVTCNGNIFLVIAITLLQGINGMCFGFAISEICESVHSAFPLALGSFYPTVLLSGIIWPIEGMPFILKYISYFSPLTQATIALRCIFARGWGLYQQEVYLGFISTLSWIKVFLMITFVLLKSKRG